MLFYYLGLIQKGDFGDFGDVGEMQREHVSYRGSSGGSCRDVSVFTRSW